MSKSGRSESDSPTVTMRCNDNDCSEGASCSAAGRKVPVGVSAGLKRFVAVGDVETPMETSMETLMKTLMEALGVSM